MKGSHKPIVGRPSYGLCRDEMIPKKAKNEDILSLLLPYLPAKVVGATSRDDFAHKRSYLSFIALDYCTWVQYNQEWVNMLIFDIDYSITIEDAWTLCIEKLGFNPTWVCQTTKGVHIGFILRDRVAYEWDKTVKLTRKIKRAVTEILGADQKGSHRLKGWWRNPAVHTHFYDADQLVSLKDFYHLLPKRSVSHRFHADLIDRQRRTGGFKFRKGFRNDWLWYRAMQITKNKEEYKREEAVFDLIGKMQAYEVQYNDAEPLDIKELHKIAGSVAYYNREGKNWVSGGEIQKREIDEGVMGFPKMQGLSEEQYKAETKRRQRLSAIRTNKEVDMATRQEHINKVNEKRKQTTRRKILNCTQGMFADEYKKQSGAWHYGKISEETGISVKTVARYIKQFEEEGILQKNEERGFKGGFPF